MFAYAWIYGLLVLFLNIVYPLISVLMLIKFKRTFSPFDQEIKKPLSHYPGITVLTSIRGDLTPLDKGLSSLMEQDYPGPMELIIAIESSKDPGYNLAKKTLEGIPHRMAVKWITDFKPEGGNPRTAKLAYASKYAKYDWIYWLAVDTYTKKDHVRKLMHKAGGNPDNYVSALPVHTGGKTVGALFENIPLVWEVLMSGLLNRTLKKPFVYGGNILFHMSLLERAGGFGPILDYLTEEVPMTSSFSKAGGKGAIAPSFVWASNGTKTFSEFYNRKVRWAMIGKFHHKKLFVSAFLFTIMWMPIIFLLTGNPLFLYSFGIYLFLKVLVVYAYHLILGLPKWQSKWSVIMVPYEFICFAYCVHALFKKRVIWAGDVMRVDPSGAVKREH